MLRTKYLIYTSETFKTNLERNMFKGDHMTAQNLLEMPNLTGWLEARIWGNLTRE